MKSTSTTITLFVVLLQAVSVVAAGFSPAQGANVNEFTRGQVADPAEAETLCGALGVMEVPDGADPYTVRACKEHPSVLDDDASPSIAKRACWTDTPAVGCSKARCTGRAATAANRAPGAGPR
ncbi:hypothetical protein V2A60_000286 [Cordyceps javanica]|uniref:Uncharacterized protein n=1 Tax=Cordyceps javanica TaxID=43265 RepID=A0A545W2W6_9HYPO|nr:hypothetical protein IF1G_04307 [Cordyceps javanica]TQW08317.1 hypothetical protein IF2G_04193 [Cordyceps javanica]